LAVLGGGGGGVFEGGVLGAGVGELAACRDDLLESLERLRESCGDISLAHHSRCVGLTIDFLRLFIADDLGCQILGKYAGSKSVGRYVAMDGLWI
jgi:hypothetical protein